MGKAILKGTVAVDIINELKCIDEVHGSATDLDLRQHQSHWWDNLPDYTMHLLLREATEHALTVEALKAQLPETADGLLRLMPQVSDLVHRVETWQPATSTVRPEYVHSVTHFNAVWRAGMLCFIYSEIYSLGPRDVRMQGCVEAVLQPLGRLSWLQACLFPFFMIAVHAGTEEARGVFLAKLADMHGLLGFQGPLSVAGVLKCIWARSDSDAAGGRNGGRVEWRSVVRDMGMELNILL
ncbi:hypothetical protein BJY01DRAFT_241755 [Aspergillus pseudoustus]|uniref:Fungal-specific transcription factor domain-containing protein n=1 Tax=Aspergillus pseudoustus TaxID=1810923 RepID=A0ABR4I7F8_9EURO